MVPGRTGKEDSWYPKELRVVFFANVACLLGSGGLVEMPVRSAKADTQN